MKYSFQIFTLGLASFLSLLHLHTLAQTPSDSSPDKQLYQRIESVYGLDQVLVNGFYYDNIYRNDLGTPFLKSIDFLPGHIVLHGIKYENIQLKFNVYDQSIVLQKKYNENQIVFIPPSDFVSEFKLGSIIFRKYSFPELETRFYQEVYSNNLKCLYFWQKKREESHENGKYSVFQFFEAKRKSYLLIDDYIYPYKSKSSFLKVLPDKNKKEIASYMKKNTINLSKSPDEKISDLIQFCETLLKENKPAVIAENANN